MCLPHFLRVLLIFVACTTWLSAMPNGANENDDNDSNEHSSENPLSSEHEQQPEPDIITAFNLAVISNIDEGLFRDHWVQVQQLSKGLISLQESHKNQAATTNEMGRAFPEKYSRGNFASASFDCHYERHLCPYGTVCDHIGHICRRTYRDH